MGRGGWTLLESVVAVAVCCLVGALALRFLHSTRRLAGGQERQQLMSQATQRFLAALRHDARSCLRFRAAREDLLLQVAELGADGRRQDLDVTWTREDRRLIRSTPGSRQVFEYPAPDRDQRLLLELALATPPAVLFRAALGLGSDTLFAYSERIPLSGEAAESAPAPVPSSSLAPTPTPVTSGGTP